jgi:hypothetical protein
LVLQARTLARKFSDITQGITRKRLTAEEFHDSYDRLQNEIEQELSGTMYLYAKQWGLSVKALFYYKQSRFNKAIDLSLECIVLNEYLVKKGLDSLLFRAAEQNKNIVRVFFRQNKMEEACQLTHAMLTYLFGGSTERLYGWMFSEPEYQDKIPYVREGYAYEFFRAVVSLLMNLGQRQQGEADIFRKVFSNVTIHETTPDRQIIAAWIAIKHQFYQKDHHGFFNALEAFFETPLCKIYDVVKISLLLDVAALAEEAYKTRGGAHYTAVIHTYINQHLNGEFYLKTDLSSRNLVALID